MSKGDSRDTEAEEARPAELGLSLKWLRVEALTAKAERRLDSLAVTGLVHPWSSVEPAAMDPAPVTASGPVQSKCWAEGLVGLRRWLRFAASKVSAETAGALAAKPERFSKPGRVCVEGVANEDLTALVWVSSPSGK